MKNDTVRRIRMTIGIVLLTLWKPVFPPGATVAEGFIHEFEWVEMRDGVRLATDIYAPADVLPPWDALLMRTPYDRSLGELIDSLFVVWATDVKYYAVVLQNMRGTEDSEGEPMAFLTDGWGPLQDGYDAIEWIADAEIWGQPLSTGKIGMIGASAPGMTQYMAAGAEPPHLVSCAPIVAGHSMYHYVAYNGGVFRKALVEGWLTGLDCPWLIDTVANHPNYDEMWSWVNLGNKWDVCNYPMLHIGGWYDLYTDGYIEAFCELQERYGNQKLYIGPWGHGSAWGASEQGDLVYPANAEVSDLDLLELCVKWHDYWIKGEDNGILDEPRIKFYLMGDCDVDDPRWNYWVETDTWPEPTYWTFYLKEGGGLSPEPPSVEVADTFQYDPMDPCTTIGGREFICIPGKYGPRDQTPIEGREDMLVYTTGVLDTPYTVIGKLKMVLYASSDCYDTDWAIRVTDVYPDGRSILVTDNILMARHRHGLDVEDSLSPGVPDTFFIDLWSTAQVFNTGHRIRVLITSSNYPRFEKNPNTGAPFMRDDTNTVVATNVVYRTPGMPSALLLPVISPEFGVAEKSSGSDEGAVLSVITPSKLPQVTLNLRQGGRIRLSIYDLSGRLVETLKDGYLPKGTHRFSPKKLLPSGIYFLNLKHAGDVQKKKVVILLYSH